MNKKFEVGEVVRLNNGDGTLRKATVTSIEKYETGCSYIVEYPETIIVSENDLIKNEEKELRYPVFVDEKNNECRAYVIGSSIMAIGKTKDEVLEQIKYSITDLIYSLLENNEKIPVPAFTDTDNDSISFVTVEV
jgi:hypothetical protein